MPNPLAGRVWEELSLYESRDLIDRFFKSRHDRDLSAEKANEITSNLAQGREYFSSAREAGELVRPLLLYYGVLALSRGLILALEPGTREASLSSSHGLVTLQWAQTLSAGIKELGKLQMQFATGTVSDLARATKNRDWGIYHGPTIPTWQVFEEAGSEHVPNGRSFLLQDVLARIPNLRDLYERTFEEHAHCYSGNVHQFITPPLQRNLYVDGTASAYQQRSGCGTISRSPQPFRWQRGLTMRFGTGGFIISLEINRNPETISSCIFLR